MHRRNRSRQALAARSASSRAHLPGGSAGRACFEAYVHTTSHPLAQEYTPLRGPRARLLDTPWPGAQGVIWACIWATQWHTMRLAAGLKLFSFAMMFTSPLLLQRLMVAIEEDAPRSAP